MLFQNPNQQIYLLQNSQKKNLKNCLYENAFMKSALHKQDITNQNLREVSLISCISFTLLP